MDNKKQILVIDDDNFMLQFVRALINKEKYDVTTCNNPLKGVQIIEEGRTDVLISDIEMPELRGTELMSMVHDINSAIPVIFISSLEKPDLETELVEAGAFGFVRKPVDPLDLEDLLQKACINLSKTA